MLYANKHISKTDVPVFHSHSRKPFIAKPAEEFLGIKYDPLVEEFIFLKSDYWEFACNLQGEAIPAQQLLRNLLFPVVGRPRVNCSPEPSYKPFNDTLDLFLKSTPKNDFAYIRSHFPAFLEVHQKDMEEVEEATRGQAENSLWFRYRVGRLTASSISYAISSTNRQKTGKVSEYFLNQLLGKGWKGVCN